MYEILTVLYLLVALALIGLILIQQGKGADMGASFGAGASGTLFGSSGSGNFLTRSTAILAVCFFALSLTIGNLSANHKTNQVGAELLENNTEQTIPDSTDAAPVAPVTEDKIPD